MSAPTGTPVKIKTASKTRELREIEERAKREALAEIEERRKEEAEQRETERRQKLEDYYTSQLTKVATTLAQVEQDLQALETNGPTPPPLPTADEIGRDPSAIPLYQAQVQLYQTLSQQHQDRVLKLSQTFSKA